MDTSLFRYKIQQLSDDIWEVADLPRGNYDGQAVQYDKLISSTVYNRLMWGNSPEDYAAFCRQGLAEDRQGIIADIGCGTLSFSAREYALNRPRNLFLCDLSQEMLAIGKKRLDVALNGEEAEFNFLRPDALNLPFTDHCIQSVFCFGFLHVLDNPSALVGELNRVLDNGGKLYLTSLCTDRNVSARYLKLLHKKGHVSTPKHSSEIVSLIQENGFSKIKSHVKGGMLYVSANK